MHKKKKDLVIIIWIASLLLEFGGWMVFKSEDDFSKSERRKLATFPQFNLQSVMLGNFMKDFEVYALDQFPKREAFRTCKAIFANQILQKKDNHDIYLQQGYAVHMEKALHEESIAHATQRFQFVYDTYMKDTDCNVYVSVIPDKHYFLGEENGYPSMDYTQLVTQVCEQMSYAKYIDIMSTVKLDDYYRTDAHWRQECLVDVARLLGQQMKTPLTAQYATKQLEVPFYGVYYGQAALTVKPDTLAYLDHELFQGCTAFDYESQREIPIYDMELAKGRDPYEMFLNGSKSLITITNPNATTDKELILFRDSYGSSIAPLFAEGYAKITLVDIRYISPQMLARFLEFDQQDVLFLYSTSVLNHSVTIK